MPQLTCLCWNCQKHWTLLLMQVLYNVAYCVAGKAMRKREICSAMADCIVCSHGGITFEKPVFLARFYSPTDRFSEFDDIRAQPFHNAVWEFYWLINFALPSKGRSGIAVLCIGWSNYCQTLTITTHYVLIL